MQKKLLTNSISKEGNNPLEFKEQSGYQEYFSKAHDMVRRSVREFVNKEILPDIDAWEEQG